MENTPDFKLSPDMVMHVLQRLDPVDILAMRATCRFFYRAAASRSVWLAALDRVCEQHRIYKPTYPTEKMTLAELEHAASGPRRFVNLVRGSSSGSSERYTGPYVTRRYPCRREAHQDGLYKVSHLALVPGGRFLFTAERPRPNGAALAIVCLWDLGYNMHCPVKPFPLATISIPKMAFPYLSLFPSSRGSEIILAVTGRSHALDGGKLNIFGIDPQRQTPEFVLYHEQSLLDAYSPPHTHLGQSIAVLMSGKSIYVVNWREQNGCRWICQNLQPFLDIMLRDNTVIAVDSDHDFLIWDIPKDLPPIEPGKEPPLISNSPKRIPRWHEGELPECNTAVAPSWQQNAPPHLCFVVNEEESVAEAGMISLYSLRRMGHQDVGFVPSYLPVAAGKSDQVVSGPTEPIIWSVTPLIFCDGQLVLCCCTTSNELVAMVLPVPTEASEDTMDLHSAMMVRGVDDNEGEATFEPYNVGFCPMSGRIVHPVSLTFLQICDFLLPLEDR